MPNGFAQRLLPSGLLRPLRPLSSLMPFEASAGLPAAGRGVQPSRAREAEYINKSLMQMYPYMQMYPPPEFAMNISLAMAAAQQAGER